MEKFEGKGKGGRCFELDINIWNFDINTFINCKPDVKQYGYYPMHKPLQKEGIDRMG